MGIETKIDAQKCKGCGLCVGVCKQKYLELSEIKEANEKGYSYARLKKDCEGKCKVCGFCYLICPDACIEIYRKKEG
jgi:2-oxoglutarate ferredoxin oxidoreductase subunit delta